MTAIEGLTPADIVAAMRADNLEAFEKIVLGFAKPLFAFFLRHLSHKQTAEDLTQDTFIKLYRSRHRFDVTQPLKPWVFTIATHTLYDYLRRQRDVSVADLSRHAAETISTSRPYQSVEAALDLEAALQRLPHIQRTALLLFYQQGLSYEEISQALQVPLNTVKTHLHRGKQALQSIYAKP